MLDRHKPLGTAIFLRGVFRALGLSCRSRRSPASVRELPPCWEAGLGILRLMA